MFGLICVLAWIGLPNLLANVSQPARCRKLLQDIGLRWAQQRVNRARINPPQSLVIEVFWNRNFSCGNHLTEKRTESRCAWG